MAQEIADSKLLDTWGSGGTKIEPDITKIIEGWQLGEQPPHEYMNWLQNTFGSKLNHILKNGVAEWNNETEYLAGASVQHSGSIWLCETTNTNSEPTDLNANWEKVAINKDLTVTVDTLADLRNISYPANTVWASGYHAKNDGAFGSHIFRLKGVKTTETDNGGTVIISTIEGTDYVYELQYDGAVNVKWFGAKGDGVADDSIAFQTVVDNFETVIVPVGNYKINITLTQRIVIHGEGGKYSKLYPYDINRAIMVYGVINGEWDYSSNITGIGFHSASKTGIGFAFGKDDINNYATNDEYKRNVIFNQCLFEGLEKGIFKPFGGIGNSFYSCGFRDNKYGVYSLSNKFGGTMHAGNMYFYDGEFSDNDCANYIHNTTDGFGGYVFRGTIFEANKITNYAYCSILPYFPISYYDCWFEGNGQTYVSGTTPIDQWTETTLTTTLLDNRTFYLDGYMEASFIGGRATGIHCIGEYCTATITNAPVVYQTGYGGEDFLTNGESNIHFNNYTIIGKRLIPNQNLNIKFDVPVFKSLYTMLLDDNVTRAGQRTLVDYAQQKLLVGGRQVEKYYSQTMEVSVNTGNGSFGLTGSVVNDSPLFPTCNEYTRTAFTTGQYTALPSITPPEGFVVLSYYVKCTVGSVTSLSWNRSTVQVISGVEHRAGDGWRLVSTMFKSDGLKSFYPVDFRGNNEDATWRVSAVQVLVFDNSSDAFNYLKSKTYTK